MLSLDSKRGFTFVHPYLLFQRLDSVPQVLTAYVVNRENQSEPIPVMLERSKEG